MSITLKRLRQRAFLKTSLEEQQGRAGTGAPLRRCLGCGLQHLVLVCWKRLTPGPSLLERLTLAGPLMSCCLGSEAPLAQGYLFSPGLQLQSMQGELL